MHAIQKTWAALAVGAALGAVLSAQDPQTKPSATDTPAELKSLKYRSIGPAAGGRVSRVAGIPGDPTTYYAATASGGVWKQEGQIGTMAVHPSQEVAPINATAAKLGLAFVAIGR